MESPALAVRKLGKSYRIGERAVPYRTLRDSVANAILAPFRGIRASRRRATEEEDHTIWALRDLEFEVSQGDIVGIVGANGAGKSTLLKILSRITEPTEGHAEVRGKVASLLEVGTGFHLELTGRENVYLNGAILGMRKKEIDAKFDEIVNFAGVERFIDTPVKHYSSGMYMRLAFSVAAHLDFHILLVDEVLAVGDAEFQRKCLGKMERVGAQGRTVLFVSHNLGAIAKLCTRGVLLDRGRVKNVGPINEVMAAYQSLRPSTADESGHRRMGSGRLKVERIVHCDRAGRPVVSVCTGHDLCLLFRMGNEKGASSIRGQLKFMINSVDGRDLFFCATSHDANGPREFAPGDQVLCRIPRLPLARGLYTISYQLKNIHGELLDGIEDACRFQVEHGDFFGTNADYSEPKVHVVNQWKILEVDVSRQMGSEPSR